MPALFSSVKLGLSSGGGSTWGRRPQQSVSRESEILSAISDHLSIVNTRYVYIAVNDAYLRAHCLDREQIVGHPVAELLGEDKFIQLIKPNLDRCFAGEEVHYFDEFSFRGYSCPKIMDVTYYPKRDESGQVVAAVVSAHDITHLKQEQERLHQLVYMDSLT